jgi:hypothetical protein
VLALNWVKSNVTHWFLNWPDITIEIRTNKYQEQIKMIEFFNRKI